ncbi:MAG TPA: alpha/beta hydrolase [Thermoanaerobaculia bacterium]|nr:alpha/beta hydrolase [Thermoanaerobaculia bacterium]
MGFLSRTAPSTASRVAMNLFMKPRRYTRPPREAEVLATATRYTVTVEGHTVQAWRWGSGPAVLLVHGWEGRGAQLAAFVAPLTAAGFTVVTFDAPGHGESEGARSSLPQFAWAVRAVADSCPELFAVVAHSLGCAATTLAIHDGLEARRLIYISPPLDPSDYVMRFGDILNITEPVLEGMKRRIEHRFRRNWSEYSLAQMAPSMSTPLLVIHDRDDDDTYWQDGATLTERWPGARMLSTQGLGHRRILRDPAVVESAMRFLIDG